MFRISVLGSWLPSVHPLTNQYNRTIMQSMKSIAQILFLMFGVVLFGQYRPSSIMRVRSRSATKSSMAMACSNSPWSTRMETSPIGAMTERVYGSEPQASVSVSVNGGLYAVLLGNTAQQGMEAIDPAVFAQHTDAKLQVWFSDGVNGFQQLSPDRPFIRSYAFSAGPLPLPTAQSISQCLGVM